MNRTQLSILGLACLLAAACASSEAAEPPRSEGKKSASSRKNVRTAPVPAGTEIACDRLIADAAISEHLGKPVVVSQRPARGETATCSIALAPAEIPKSKRAKAKLAADNGGLLPGDELCEVSVQCSHILDVDGELARCAGHDGVSDRDVGAVGCMREFARERFSYASLDYDTGCRYEVVAGAQTGDAAKDAVRACAAAVVDAITTDQIAPAAAADQVAAETR